MPKRVLPLSDAQLRSAKPRTATYCLFDGGGLFLEVTPTGSKLWRFKFKSPTTGKAGLLSLGKYPEAGLEKARLKAVELRRLIANGDDPSEQRKIEKSLAIAQSQTFEMLARRWIEKEATGWKPMYRHDVTRKLKLNVFPSIGMKPIAQVTVSDIEAVLRTLTARGVHATAHRTLSIVKAIFDLAVIEELIPFNPGNHPKVRACLQKKPPVKHFAAITTPSELSRLLLAIEAYPGNIVKAAIQLLTLTFVRSTELREARWKEFDLKGKQWTIPGGRTKNKLDLCVPLSKQALTILKRLKVSTHSEPDDLVFPSYRPGRSISTNTIGMALRVMGFSNMEMTTHGFRGTASTLLNSSGLWSKDAIERQLGHIEINKVRSAYCHTDFLEERRKMMQWWADYLDELKNESR